MNVDNKINSKKTDKSRNSKKSNKKKSKLSTNESCKANNDYVLTNKKQLLIVTFYASLLKTLNGSIPGSKISPLLKLYTHSGKYNGKGDKLKEEKVSSYFIKGIRGSIRHIAMTLCKERGIQVCDTHDRPDKLQSPDNFHLSASCRFNGSKGCIILSIFGAKGIQGKISFYHNPVASYNYDSKFEINLQKVHIATDKRVCFNSENEPIQDFGERFVSGFITFEIDVSKLNNEELGLIIEATKRFERLGRGYNSGSGHIEIKKFKLVNRTIEYDQSWENDTWVNKKNITDISLKDEVLQAIKGWNNYAISS